MSHPDPWQGQPGRAARSIRRPALPQRSGKRTQGLPTANILGSGQWPPRPAEAFRGKNIGRPPEAAQTGRGRRRGRPPKAAKKGQGPAEKEVIPEPDPDPQHHRHLILALDSGVKEEIAGALNELNRDTFGTADSDSPFLASAELLGALLALIQAGRAIPVRSVEVAKQLFLGDPQWHSYSDRGPPRPEYESTTSATVLQSGNCQNLEEKTRSNQDPEANSEFWWIKESEVFNLDEGNRLFQNMAAAAASNVIRNLACIPINEKIMAENKRCVHILIECMQDRDIEDEELVTNCLDVLAILGPSLRQHLFTGNQMTPSKAIETIVDVLESPVEEWQKYAAYLLGCFAMDPDTDYDPYLLPFLPRVYRRLVGLAGVPETEVQEAAVSALARLSNLEVLRACHLQLLEQSGAIARLLSIVQAPHPSAKVVETAAKTLLRLVAGTPEGIAVMQRFESTCVDIAFSDHVESETFARILAELTPKEAPARAPDCASIWGTGTEEVTSEKIQAPDDASLWGTGEATSEITQAPDDVRATASSSSEVAGYPDDVRGSAAEGGEDTASSCIGFRSGSSSPRA